MSKEELAQQISDIQFDIDRTRKEISKMKLEIMNLESLLLEYSLKKERLLEQL